MHDIAVLDVFEESLFLKIENNSVLRNRVGARCCELVRATWRLPYASLCMRR